LPTPPGKPLPQWIRTLGLPCRKPRRVVDAVSSGEQAWRIEPFSDTPGNGSVFIERQKQIEELLVNSIGMPIRLFQEGRASGSRAELESFTDIAVTIMESRNHILATAIQEQIVNHLTLINFGIDDLVQIQVGNVKQSQKFFERHPTLDPKLSSRCLYESRFRKRSCFSQYTTLHAERMDTRSQDRCWCWRTIKFAIGMVGIITSRCH